MKSSPRCFNTNNRRNNMGVKALEIGVDRVIGGPGEEDIDLAHIQKMMKQARDLSNQLGGLFKTENPDALHEAHRVKLTGLSRAVSMHAKDDDGTTVKTYSTESKLRIATMAAQLALLLYQLYKAIVSGATELGASTVTALMEGLDPIAKQLRQIDLKNLLPGLKDWLPDFSTAIA
jgi:hypothetical protein